MPNNNNTAILFSHVTLGYENIVTTPDLNLTIHPGDYICLIGENGSGKSTFVKSLLGLVKPLKGSIHFHGDWSRSSIGYLPQQTPAQRDFPASVQEIVRSGFLSKMGMRPFYTRQEKQQVEAAMERLNLIPLRKRCYRELSGGQQQRVLLARALCAAQKLLVLDEPTTGLDAESSAELYRILQELNQTESITILMVTHDLENACAAAKQVLYFEPGGYFFGTAAAFQTRSMAQKGAN